MSLIVVMVVIFLESFDSMIDRLSQGKCVHRIFAFQQSKWVDKQRSALDLGRLQHGLFSVPSRSGRSSCSLEPLVPGP